MNTCFPVTLALMLERKRLFELSNGNPAIFQLVRQHEQYHALVATKIKPQYI